MGTTSVGTELDWEAKGSVTLLQLLVDLLPF